MSVLVLDTIKNPNERYNKYNKFGMSDKGNLFVTTWMNNYDMKCKKKLHLRITYIISKNGIYYKTINNKICRIKDKSKQIKDFKSSFKNNICEFIYAYIEHSHRSEEVQKAILRIFLDFLSQSVDYKLLADAMKPVESKLVNIFYFNSFIFKLIDILDLFKYFNNNCKVKSIRKLLFSHLNINPNSTSDELRLWINKLRIILQSYYHWSKTIGIKDINCLRTLIDAGIKYNFDCDSLMQFNIRQQRFIVKTMGETVFTNKFINYLKDIHNKANNKYLDGTYQYRQMLPKLKLVRRIWQNFDYNILKGNFNEIIEKLVSYEKLARARELQLNVVEVGDNILNLENFEFGGKYRFNVAQNHYDLKEISEKMNNCVYNSYINKLNKNHSIVTVMDNDDYVVCLEIYNNKCMQIKGKSNSEFTKNNTLATLIRETLEKFNINTLNNVYMDSPDYVKYPAIPNMQNDEDNWVMI